MPEESKSKKNENVQDFNTISVPIMYYAVGFVFRLTLARSDDLVQWLSWRNEIGSPLTSFRVLSESIALKNAGISPYAGDLCHFPPLILGGFAHIMKILPTAIEVLFSLADCLTAYLLAQVAFRLGTRHLETQKKFKIAKKDYSELVLTPMNTLVYAPRYVALAYLFNPFSVAACVAKSTGVLDGLWLASFFLAMLRGKPLAACFWLALATYSQLYPVILLVPLCLSLAQAKSHANQSLGVVTLKTCVMFGIISTFLVFISGAIRTGSPPPGLDEGDVWWVNSVYGFILGVPDFTPNLGMFWYFFAESFDHFRTFFVCVFQLHVFVYPLPLGLKLKNDPPLLTFILISIIAIMKSYPDLGAIGFYLSLIPAYGHLSSHFRNSLFVSVLMIVSVVLAPVLWYLWIFARSANSNFYFALSLTFNVANILLITDIVYAQLKRNFHLKNGCLPERSSLPADKQPQVWLQ